MLEAPRPEIKAVSGCWCCEDRVLDGITSAKHHRMEPRAAHPQRCRVEGFPCVSRKDITERADQHARMRYFHLRVSPESNGIRHLKIVLSSRRFETHTRPYVGVFQKSIIDRFINFWRYFPTKWLQNRTQIPRPYPGIPPRRAFCGCAKLPPL